MNNEEQDKPVANGMNRMARRSDDNEEGPVRNYSRLYIKTRKIQYFFIVSDGEDEWTPTSSRRKKMKKISKSSSSKKGKKRTANGKYPEKNGKMQKKKRFFQMKGNNNKDAPAEQK